MESYAFQDLSLKRIKKLAAKFSDDEIRSSLSEDEDNRAFIFEQPDGHASAMIWNVFQGLMTCLDDDGVRAYAQVEFLQRHDYPVARSLEEVHILANRYHWPRKEPHSCKSRD